MNFFKSRKFWLGFHLFIICNFFVEIFYSAYMIFWVLRGPGGPGPLGAAGGEISNELMIKRRLYGIEAWLAIGGLAVYLAITEIGPRLRKPRDND